MPQHIWNTDPHAAANCDHFDDSASHSAAYNDCYGYRKKFPLFARQTVSVPTGVRELWFPSTVIHKASNGSYLVPGIAGGDYWCAHDHICEIHPDAISPDEPLTSNQASVSSTALLATQAARSTTLITPATLAPAALVATLFTSWEPLPTESLPCHLNTQSTGLSWAWLTQPKQPHANLPKSGSNHLSFSKKYRPRQSLQMTLMTSWPTLSLVQLLKYCSIEVIHDDMTGWSHAATQKQTKSNDNSKEAHTAHVASNNCAWFQNM